MPMNECPSLLSSLLTNSRVVLIKAARLTPAEGTEEVGTCAVQAETPAPIPSPGDGLTRCPSVSAMTSLDCPSGATRRSEKPMMHTIPTRMDAYTQSYWTFFSEFRFLRPANSKDQRGVIACTHPLRRRFESRLFKEGRPYCMADVQ